MMPPKNRVYHWPAKAAFPRMRCRGACTAGRFETPRHAATTTMNIKKIDDILPPTMTNRANRALALRAKSQLDAVEATTA
mmetsp:Transcript_6629/g.7214  ORF Transcript_6629/g.7214 Transcript_6629/m.7214 type:complete len:80 (+) Transcript_6629:78-317(+)